MTRLPRIALAATAALLFPVAPIAGQEPTAEPDPEAGLPRDAYASSGPASASSRRTARSSLPIESARSSTTRCVTPSRSYSRVRREPCAKTCELLGSVLA